MQALRTITLFPIRLDPMHRTRVEDHSCYIVDFFDDKPAMEMYRAVVKAAQMDTKTLALSTVMVQGN